MARSYLSGIAPYLPKLGSEGVDSIIFPFPPKFEFCSRVSDYHIWFSRSIFATNLYFLLFYNIQFPDNSKKHTIP
ncbi:hypothetical protein FUAX_51930 (plasmid) [Fulvitalea axinellae]|uniref:Uncharacterized protein n=1 Tax=Fulvitalea axinellae TaxID=1182444 RepID=A0AAU9DI27_9BACT|nr:hypothetical protein FUAX_51930 [Fulvitalea axinellae]